MSASAPLKKVKTPTSIRRQRYPRTRGLASKVTPRQILEVRARYRTRAQCRHQCGSPKKRLRRQSASGGFRRLVRRGRLDRGPRRAPTYREKALLRARSEEKERSPQADSKEESVERPADKKQLAKDEDLRVNERSAPTEQPPPVTDSREKAKQAIEEAAELSDGAAAGRETAGAAASGDAARGRVAGGGGGGYGAARGGGLGGGGLGGYGYGNTGDGTFRGGFDGARSPGGPQLDAVQTPVGSATRVRLLGRPSTLGLADDKAITELKLRGAVRRTEESNGEQAAGEVMQKDKQLSDAFGARVAKENQAKDVPAQQLETSARSFGTAGTSPEQNQGIDPSAQQQVLFFFRIVDAPLAKAATQSQVEAGRSGRAKAALGAGIELQDREAREATPVPAPAVPPSAVK